MTRTWKRLTPEAIPFLLPLIAVLVIYCAASGQSLLDGQTTPGLAPGAPAGSYALSGFESVNLFNGRLNFSLPLKSVGGRGGVGYTIPLKIESEWSVDRHYCEAACGYDNISDYGWLSAPVGFSPGVLVGRQSTDIPSSCSGTQLIPYRSQTLLTFKLPDGTEYELVDQSTAGQPHSYWWYCPNQSPPMFTHGPTWATRDGTSATFISETAITDSFQNGSFVFPTGYLMLRDGTRYRIVNGNVQWTRDRNGNQLTFNYELDQYQSSHFTQIVDSLNRKVTVCYMGSSSASCPNNPYDSITYTGFGGLSRTIKIWYARVGDIFNGLALLRGDFPSLRRLHDLFPEADDPQGINNTVTWNPTRAAAVELPDGRQYRFQYNPYGELARVVLPTSGAFEYDWSPCNGGGTCTYGGIASVGQPWDPTGVFRSVSERRVYSDGATLESKDDYSGFGTFSSLVDHKSANGTVLAHEVHYFHGSTPTDDLQANPLQPESGYPSWNEGKEYQTDQYAADATTLLRRTTNNWQNPNPPSWCGTCPNNPKISDTQTTLADTNQQSKRHFDYDQYNNVTDLWEYDYGAGAVGSLLRHTHTTYISTLNGYDYACDPSSTCSSNATLANVIHLRSLPDQTSVFDGGELERARTKFEYDNYVRDAGCVAVQLCLHDTLVPRAGISGLCDGTQNCPNGPNFTDPNYLPRGNVTKTTHYLFDNTNGSVIGSVNGYSQYDVAGNTVKIIDPRSTSSNIIATTFDYRDNFGTPDDAVQIGGNPSNVPPLELSSQTSYAFPFAERNAMGHISYTKSDYYLGRAVAVEDPNSVRSKIYFNDLLDRPKQVQRALGTSDQSQTTFDYDDLNRVITTTSDQNSLADGVLVSKSLYDGLGRTTETRQYEGGGRYIAGQTQYDALGRAYKTSNPFRPLAPDYQSPVWTLTDYDALSRVKSVTTPDTAVVNSYYDGNRVLVKDQAGKERMSQTSALGQLTHVWEITTADQWTEGISFAGHPEVTAGYHTLYEYDTLDDLTSVTQGTQPLRTFKYDSLKRLTSASNPESGAVCYGTVVGGQCQANGYDANGNLVYKTDARQVLTSFDPYDALNRPTARRYSDGTPTVTYAYDTATNGKGRLASVSSSVSTYNYSGYDAMGRVTGGSETISGQPSQTYLISYTYDLAGHVRTMTYPSGNSVTYNYDSAGRLADKDAQNLAFTGNLGTGGAARNYSTGITYSPFGGKTQEQFGTTTPVYDKLFYNSRQQLAEILASTTSNDAGWDRGKIVNGYSLQCSGASCNANDNNGNLEMQQHWIPNADGNPAAIFTQQYDYDSLNRLWRVSDDRNFPGWRQQYTYDRYGNRTIDQNNTWNTGVPTWNFGVDTGTNRLTPPGGWTMNYDAAGNLTYDNYTGQGTRTYDAENRMITANNGADVYSYDGDGHRVKRRIGNTETWQVYGVGGELIAEYPQNGSPQSPQKEYGYRNGQLLVTATVTAGSGGSPFSFTDDPLVAGTTLVKATHLTELRTAVNQTRAHAGLSAAAWTDDPAQAAVTTIKAVHITELRARLDEARTALGLSAANYTDPGLTSGYTIKAAHIQELRAKANEALTVGGSGGIDLRWLVTDQLGTPRMIFDQSGSLANVSRHDDLPFGEELSGGSRTSQLGYTNSDGARQHFTLKERDIETGLDYSLARYYSAMQGRFTSVDPLIESAKPAQPQGWNRYSYAINNPLKYIDPSGLIWGTYTDNTGQDHYHWYKDQKELEASGATAVNVSSGHFIYEAGSGQYIRLNAAGPNPEASDAAGRNGWAAYDSFGGALEHQNGERGDTSTGVDQAFSLALSDTGGRIAANVGARLLARVLARTTLDVAGAAEMQVVRTIGQGERIADIVNEAKAFTFQTGNEHALVTLANGERALVSGGQGGINFGEGQITRLFGHTHGYQFAAGGASAADRAAIQALGQRSSWVLERGQLLKFGRQ